MTRDKLTALEKLEKLEKRKKELIEQRKTELLSIIEKTNSLTIDDRLLASFLIFASNPKNKDNPLLSELKNLSKTTKMPSNKEAKPNDK